MRKLIFALAFGAILLPNNGFTLGLGEIEVNSSLNQRLESRIELLSAIPEDVDNLIIKLASREEFIRAGLDRPLEITKLKFKSIAEDGRVYVNVTSPKPVREPFLNFLIEVDWPKGHLLREYTILLDPPVFMTQRGSQATPTASPSPRSVAVQSSAGNTYHASSQAPASNESVASVPVAEDVSMQQTESVQQTSYTAPSYAPAGGHRIQAGDTAWSIANSMRPDDSVSVAQMLIAMLNANPEVFINENVNGLKRGYILRAPDYADITAVSNEQAKAAVRQQNALWREYQQSLSSDQPASAVDEDYSESEHSSEVEVNGDSRLSIVSAGGGASASGDMKDPTEMSMTELRDQLALARERVETELVEKEELQGQVSSLTEQVGKMKGLLTIEDDAMAEIQSVGVSSDDVAMDAETADVSDADEVVMDDEFSELDIDETQEDLTTASDEDLTALDMEAEEDLTEEVFVDEATQQAVEEELFTEQDMMAESEPAYAAPEDTSLIGMLLNNKIVIFGILLLILIVGAIGYLIKRRRDSAAEPDLEAQVVEDSEVSEIDDLEDVADMIDDESIDDLVSDEEIEASLAEAEAEEEEFDAEATMILPSGTNAVISPAADLQLKASAEEEEEQDDVTAEADVYMAYGIYQQAEELLENAIKENPEKDVYRVKLAEAYFAGKNSEALAKLGTDMKERVGDEETPAWNKVVAMGKELCPEAEVFQQASAGADLDLDDMMPKAAEPTMDFDLGDDTGGGTPELDMDFDLSTDDAGSGDELELPSMGDAMDETAIISPEEPAESLDEIDELEFDLSETDAIEEAPAEEEFSLDIEASELDLGEAEESADDAGMDLDLDMSMDSEAEPISDDSDSGMDLDLDMSMDADESADDSEVGMDLDMSMDLDESTDESEDGLDMDLDMSMDELASEGSDEEVEFDLSEEAADDVSLDDLSSELEDDLDEMDLSEPLDAEEVDTKMDLAKAYLDMGDHEGARDILDEVIAGGNATQKKEAEELMAQAG